MVHKKFEEYVAQREPRHDHHDDHCICCGGGAPLLDGKSCHACLKYEFGYDQAEAQLVMAMIGSAVTGALEAGATAELVAFAFRGR